MYEPTGRLTLEEAATQEGLSWQGDGSLPIEGVAPLEDNKPGYLSFVRKRGSLLNIDVLKGSILVVPNSLKESFPADQPLIISDRPDITFVHIFRELYYGFDGVMPTFGCEGIHPRATLHDSVHCEEGVTIEPGVVVGRDVVIGSGSYIGANTVIGEGVTIGRDVSIGSNTVLQACHLGDKVMIGHQVSLGFLGFGLVNDGARRIERFPHIGKIIIQKDVHIGSLTAIDRSTISDSVIGEGTRIDGMVRIGHNCQIGRHVTICSMVGIGGNCHIEDWVVIAADVGLAGHLRVGKGAILLARSSIFKDIPEGEKIMGLSMRSKDYINQLVWLNRMSRKIKNN